MNKLYPYLSLIDSFSFLKDYAITPIIQEESSLIPKYKGSNNYKPSNQLNRSNKQEKARKKAKAHKKYYHKKY